MKNIKYILASLILISSSFAYSMEKPNTNKAKIYLTEKDLLGIELANAIINAPCYHGKYKEKIENLLKLGANPNTESLSHPGLKPLSVALHRGHYDLANLLIEAQERNRVLINELIFAIQNNDQKTIKLLLVIYSNLFDFEDGNNALHLASKIDNKDMFKFILKIKPGLINKKNYAGQSPIHLNRQMLIYLILDYKKNSSNFNNNFDDNYIPYNDPELSKWVSIETNNEQSYCNII